MTDKYEITDKDIEIALRYLKYHDSENATPEKAIALLTDLRQGYHGIAHTNPDILLDLQRELGKNKSDNEKI